MVNKLTNGIRLLGVVILMCHPCLAQENLNQIHFQKLDSVMEMVSDDILKIEISSLRRRRLSDGSISMSHIACIVAPESAAWLAKNCTLKDGEYLSKYFNDNHRDFATLLVLYSIIDRYYEPGLSGIKYYLSFLDGYDAWTGDQKGFDVEFLLEMLDSLLLSQQRN